MHNAHTVDTARFTMEVEQNDRVQQKVLQSRRKPMLNMGELTVAQPLEVFFLKWNQTKKCYELDSA